MTISSASNRISYTGNGTTTAFSYPYEFDVGSDLKVYKAGTLQTITTHYTVSGGSGSSGTVTFVTAPASGDSVVIYDDPPATQLLDYIANDPFPAESHEGGLDKLTRLIRRLKDRIDRAMRLSDSDVSGASTTLPTPAASKVLGWNAAANALVNYSASDLTTVAAFSAWQSQRFSGNGSTVAFTLTSDPGNVNNLDVSIGGVTQQATADYTVSGTTLTFTTAPVTGTNNIFVRWGQALPQSITNANAVNYTPSGTGAVVRTIESKLRESISLVDFGADPTGLLPCDTAFLNWKTACDAVDAEGLIPAGTFLITADAELPKKVQCEGTITGAFYALYMRRQNGWVKGLKAAQFKLRGCFFCTVADLQAPLVVVDGYDNSFGTFWCEFLQWRVDTSLTIDITNWSVNQNTWRGGRIGYCNLTGTAATYAGTEAHNNVWDTVDFTSPAGPSRGLLQNDAKMQVNHIRSCYFEQGSDIEGNFHVTGWHGDGNAPPRISRFTHILGATGVNSKLSRDYMSLTVRNLVRGGNWDWLDADGKPPGVAHSGGASVSVQTDTTEPGGIGKRYQADFADAFDNFTITLQPSGVDRFGLVVYYKSTADFVAIESNDGGGAISHTVSSLTIDSVNNWKMIRLSGPASKTSTTSVMLFAYAGAGGATKTMSIGGVFAGCERAIIYPGKNDTYRSQLYSTGHVIDQGAVKLQAGVVGQGYVAAPTTVDVVVTFPEAFASTTMLSVTAQVEATGAPSANASKVQVKSGTLTVNGCTLTVTYAVDFQGNLHWHAIGRR